MVVAELTGANPNVYLEVGYAWALKVPAVLLACDVKGHRGLVHRIIRELEALLAAELATLGSTA